MTVTCFRLSCLFFVPFGDIRFCGWDLY